MLFETQTLPVNLLWDALPDRERKEKKAKMSRESHEKAAQYHEYAAKAHRRAADYLATSDQLAARDQARNAFDYSRFAYELSARAKAAIEEKFNRSKLNTLAQEEPEKERQQAVSASW